MNICGNNSVLSDSGRGMFAKPFHRPRGLGDIEATGEPGSPDWLTQVTDSIKSLVTAYNTQQIMEANTERIARGLPPLDPSQYAPQVNVGMSPQLQSALMLGGAALLVVLLTRKA